MLKINRNKLFLVGLAGIAILVLAFFVLPRYLPATFSLGPKVDLASVASSSTTTVPAVPVKKVATHMEMPLAVKGIYMTACVAGTPSFRQKLVKLIDETELNTVIIDIKDYTGTVSFDAGPEFSALPSSGCQVADMADFVEVLHKKNIYVIGRITAFQDPLQTRLHPDWAVKKNSDRNVVWKDRKGLSFVDAGARPMWEYLVRLARASYEAGFDEINFDYIRFPSDGDMKDIYYPWSEQIWAAAKIISASTSTASSTATTTKPIIKLSNKALVMESFFKFLHQELKDSGMKLSVDFFGMTATNYDDLNIGQVLETAVPYFDYICPMVYPSHYPPGFLGYNSVTAINAHPYEIVKYSMDFAVKRLVAMGADPLKLRPWLQDNDYPVPYTPAMVRTQIQATYDAGLTSWMLWDAGNTYTREALNVI
jgi:hypothetical protein